MPTPWTPTSRHRGCLHIADRVARRRGVQYTEATRVHEFSDVTASLSAGLFVLAVFFLTLIVRVYGVMSYFKLQVQASQAAMARHGDAERGP